MVSERRMRKAIDRVQHASAATYQKRIGVFFQPGFPDNLWQVPGLEVAFVHRAGMREVLAHHPPPHVAARLLMEGACFEVLARYVGRPAGVLAPEVIHALAIESFRRAANEFSKDWGNNYKLLSEDELGMCFIYSMHSAVAEVGPWPGAHADLWQEWIEASRTWLAQEAQRDPQLIMSAAQALPDPNEAFAYIYRRRHGHDYLA